MSVSEKNAISLADLPACPVETTLTLISDKWKVLILRDLMPGTKRFGELKKSIGHVSQKVLTSQLRQMEQSGLVSRKVYAEVPPRVEYTLTDLGYSLRPIMDAMWSWGENYKKKNSPPKNLKLPDIRFVFCNLLLFLFVKKVLQTLHDVSFPSREEGPHSCEERRYSHG